MTKPTTTTNSADTIAQVLALQSNRISRIEAAVNRIERMLEASRPHEDQQKEATP